MFDGLMDPYIKEHSSRSPPALWPIPLPHKYQGSVKNLHHRERELRRRLEKCRDCPHREQISSPKVAWDPIIPKWRDLDPSAALKLRLQGVQSRWEMRKQTKSAKLIDSKTVA